MVKLKGPMFSQQASGTLAKTLTVSSWKGRSYAKKISAPTNNDQPLQRAGRRGMTFLATQWNSLSPTFQQTWEPPAQRKLISPFDEYIGYNLARIAENKGPTVAYPATPIAFPATLAFANSQAFYSFVLLTIGLPMIGNLWGVNVYRNSILVFPHDREFIAQIVLGANLPTIVEIRDIPPARGTWFYRFSPFDEGGTLTASTVTTSIVW